MEIYTERVIFRRVLDKLELLGSTLELALNVGGVDANSLNRMKEAAEKLCNLDCADFINEWLEEEDAREYLQIYIKKVWQMHRLENTKHKPEELEEDYAQLADTYDRVRNTIILKLSKLLKDNERIDEKGNIYEVNTEEINDEFGNTYRIDKPIEEPPKKESQLNEKQLAAFEELIKQGYMSKSGNGYKWNGTNALLAYTMEKIFCTSQEENFPDTMLSRMFGVTRLGQSRYQLCFSRNNPRGADEIDKILG